MDQCFKYWVTIYTVCSVSSALTPCGIQETGDAILLKVLKTKMKKLVWHTEQWSKTHSMLLLMNMYQRFTNVRCTVQNILPISPNLILAIWPWRRKLRKLGVRKVNECAPYRIPVDREVELQTSVWISTKPLILAPVFFHLLMHIAQHQLLVLQEFREAGSQGR